MMKATLPLILAALLVPSAGVAAAGAAELRAEYSDLDFKDCTIFTIDEMGFTSACPGLRGYPVLVGEGDLRQFVSYGLKAGDEPAAQQTPGPFNHVGKKIEWRVDASDPDDLQPVATILRWFIDADEGVGRPAGEILIVTQLKPGATCHIAYIDAKATKNANELARKLADAAGSFDCSREPERVQPFKAF
jgi:hypothetical protein